MTAQQPTLRLPRATAAHSDVGARRYASHRSQADECAVRVPREPRRGAGGALVGGRSRRGRRGQAGARDAVRRSRHD
eukprot:3837519-Prymnesium_polylepis.1